MAKQYHIGLDKDDIGRYVILPGDPGRVPVIASFLDRAEKVAQNRNKRIIIQYGTNRIQQTICRRRLIWHPEVPLQHYVATRLCKPERTIFLFK